MSTTLISSKSSTCKILLMSLKEALKTLQQIPSDDSSLDAKLQKYFKKNAKRYGKRDRAFISTIIYTYIRNKLLAEAWHDYLTNSTKKDVSLLHLLISLTLKKQLNALEFADLCKEPAIAETIPQSVQLSISINFEEIYLGRVPSHSLPDSELERIALTYSFPDSLIKKWVNCFGLQNTEQLCEYLNDRAPVEIRVNTHKISRKELAQKLRLAGISSTPCLYSPVGLIIYEDVSLYNTAEFKDGLFEVQDEGSQLVSFLINPLSDETVWDVCAGSGGKSLHLSTLMNNAGTVLATDINAQKIRELRLRAQRAAVENISTSTVKKNISKKDTLIDKKVDKLIIDAPCSSTGRIRRNPELKWTVTPQIINRHARDNFHLLSTFSEYVKTGGYLFYITCSLEVEENEGVIDRFLERHKEFSPGVFTPHSESPIKPRKHLFRINPLTYSTDGFFIAVLRKI